MMMILIAYGTRPEYLKVKPLMDVLDENNFPYTTLLVGQHADLDADGYYKIPVIDGLNRLDSIIESVMNEVSFPAITHVLVQGDTSTAFAVALSAHHHGMKVIHLEAGLRTYDNKNPWPEEQNRRMISQLASIHLCPTIENADNLHYEKVSGDVYVVGNTSIDNLVKYKDQCEYTNKVLVTLHRRENHKIMEKWFKELEDLTISYPGINFVFPLHSNPEVQKHKYLLFNVDGVNPMSHNDLLLLLTKVKLVITDSGGLQEECSYLNKKCLVCRTVTERPEVVGTSSFMVSDPEDLWKIFTEHISDYKIDYPCPFGEGKSSDKIFKILKYETTFYRD